MVSGQSAVWAMRASGPAYDLTALNDLPAARGRSEMPLSSYEPAALRNAVCAHTAGGELDSSRPAG